MATAVGCSGSIHARQLGLFEAEVRSILAGQQPQLVHVVYFDAEVHRHETYQAGQPIHLTQSAVAARIFARASVGWKKRESIRGRSSF